MAEDFLLYEASEVDATPLLSYGGKSLEHLALEVPSLWGGDVVKDLDQLGAEGLFSRHSPRGGEECFVGG